MQNVHSQPARIQTACSDPRNPDSSRAQERTAANNSEQQRATASNSEQQRATANSSEQQRATASKSEQLLRATLNEDSIFTTILAQFCGLCSLRGDPGPPPEDPFCEGLVLGVPFWWRWVAVWVDFGSTFNPFWYPGRPEK